LNQNGYGQNHQKLIWLISFVGWGSGWLGVLLSGFGFW